MIIKRLYIENFGPIAHLEIKPSGNLVGVIGVNGKGKSHVLAALKALFTGDLRDNQATYIRQGQKACEISATFVVQGREGILTRRVTPSRSLTSLQWEDKEYTKAEPIIRVLEDVFGCSREVIGQVAFRPQGELNSLLFGPDYVRDQLFSNMLSADFSKPRDILNTKAGVLRRLFSDLSPILFEEQAREQEALLIEWVSSSRKITPEPLELIGNSIEALQPAVFMIDRKFN